MTNINENATKLQEGSPGDIFYRKLSGVSGKLIALMIGKGVKDKVSQFREINRVANRGIRKMEWNAFKRMHGMR